MTAPFGIPDNPMRNAMTDFRPTNEKIAELLGEQTYDERVEMAQWLQNALNDQRADLAPEDGFTVADIADLLKFWAEEVIANGEEQP